MITVATIITLLLTIIGLAASIWVWASVGWELALVLILVIIFLGTLSITNWCDVNARRSPFDPKRGWGYQWDEEKKSSDKRAWRKEMDEKHPKK